MRTVKNARITSTMLGIEDHGCFTCVLMLDYGGSGQGFGQHELGYHSYGIKYIRKILETVGVVEWEQLPGKYIRVDTEHSKVHGIGHITEEKWFFPEQDLTGKDK